MVPATGIFEVRHDVLYRTAVKHVAPCCLRRLRSCYHVTSSLPVGSALLRHDPTAFKPHVAIAADEVHRTMNLRILKVHLTQVVVAEVRVLIRQQAHAVANGSRSLVLQRHGTSGRSCGIVVQRILQRQVLQVVVRSAILEDGRLADTLVLHVGFVLNHRTLYALPYEGDVVARNLSQHRLA